MKLTGNAKLQRDEKIRKFAESHPVWTQREIGEKFGVSQRVVAEALNDKVTK